MNAKRISDCANEIRQTWAEGGATTLKLALVVVAAKQKLRRGEWTSLWLDGNPPFCQRKAEMLVVIGRGLPWANPQTFACLPQGWTILYYLARIERSVLQDLIERGIVHPFLTLQEARELLDLGPAALTMPNLPRVSAHLNRFSNFVHETFPIGTMRTKITLEPSWTDLERWWRKSPYFRLDHGRW